VIEQIMIFAIGVLVAALMALLILPGLSRRAERLARRRVEARLPTSMAQIAAERDQLRAELAIEARKVELRAEAVAGQKAQHLIEIGRRDVEIGSLQFELAARSKALSELEHAHAALTVSNNETKAVLERTSAELATTSAHLATRDSELATLRDQHRHLNEVAEERRLSIAGLQTTVEGLRVRISDLERSTAETGVQLGNVRATLSERETQVSVLQHRLATLQHEKDERDKLIEQLRRDLAGATDNAELAATSNGALELRLAQAEAHARKGDADLQDATRKLHDLRDELATALETLRTDRAAAEGALETARAERRALEHELDTLRRNVPAPAEAPPRPPAAERTPKGGPGKGSGLQRERRPMRLATSGDPALETLAPPPASDPDTSESETEHGKVSVASGS
jgi:chromosome segregation ATPase